MPFLGGLCGLSAPSYSALLGEFGEAALQDPALGLLARELERPLVGSARFGVAAEAPAEVGPRGVSEAVVGKVAAREDGVHQGKPRFRSIAHRHRNGAV